MANSMEPHDDEVKRNIATLQSLLREKEAALFRESEQMEEEARGKQVADPRDGKDILAESEISLSLSRVLIRIYCKCASSLTFRRFRVRIVSQSLLRPSDNTLRPHLLSFMSLPGNGPRHTGEHSLLSKI